MSEENLKQDFTQVAKALIARIKFLTLATASKAGQPWNSPVFFAYDDDYNLYWGSYKESQHSRNVRDNQRVFIAIYDSTVPPGKADGVYIEANAEELINDLELARAIELLHDRFGAPYMELSDVQGDAVRRLYRAAPLRTWALGKTELPNGETVDGRIAIQLP